MVQTLVKPVSLCAVSSSSAREEIEKKIAICHGSIQS